MSKSLSLCVCLSQKRGRQVRDGGGERASESRAVSAAVSRVDTGAVRASATLR